MFKLKFEKFKFSQIEYYESSFFFLNLFCIRNKQTKLSCYSSVLITFIFKISTWKFNSRKEIYMGLLFLAPSTPHPPQIFHPHIGHTTYPLTPSLISGSYSEYQVFHRNNVNPSLSYAVPLFELQIITIFRENFFSFAFFYLLARARPLSSRYLCYFYI